MLFFLFKQIKKNRCLFVILCKKLDHHDSADTDLYLQKHRPSYHCKTDLLDSFILSLSFSSGPPSYVVVTWWAAWDPPFFSFPSSYSASASHIQLQSSWPHTHTHLHSHGNCGCFQPVFVLRMGTFVITKRVPVDLVQIWEFWVDFTFWILICSDNRLDLPFLCFNKHNIMLLMNKHS